MKSLLIVSFIVFGGCAASGQSKITESPKCVEAPTKSSETTEKGIAPTVSTKTSEVRADCDDEHTVATKVEALRARHVSGELNADQLYAEQGAVIDGACFKSYLPTIEDDMTPMGPGPATRLRKLKSLYDAGIVDEAEYQAKKRQILEVL